MATRSVFTFSDDYGTHHAYKHFDGYPEGAARSLREAMEDAWELPRYEADEFGAAFVAANKDRPGGVRLTSSWRDHVDLRYRYEVFQEGKTLWIRALEVSCSYPDNLWSSEEIFCGPLNAFIREHTAEEEQEGPDSSNAAPDDERSPAAVQEQTGHLFEALPNAA